MDDHSIIVPIVIENIDIVAHANLNLGEEGTAFSKISGNGGSLRVRVYF